MKLHARLLPQVGPMRAQLACGGGGGGVCVCVCDDGTALLVRRVTAGPCKQDARRFQGPS